MNFLCNHSTMFQLLVYQVLSKIVEVIDPSVSEHATLERKCFMDLKCYLTDNPDCKRYYYISSNIKRTCFLFLLPTLSYKVVENMDSSRIL